MGQYVDVSSDVEEERADQGHVQRKSSRIPAPCKVSRNENNVRWCPIACQVGLNNRYATDEDHIVHIPTKIQCAVVNPIVNYPQCQHHLYPFVPNYDDFI